MITKTAARNLFVASLVAGAGVWSYFFVQDRLRLSHRLNYAKDISLACRFYAHDHGGRIPNNFDDLSPWEGKSYEPGIAAVVQRNRYTFEFVSKNLTQTSDPSSILAKERMPDSQGRRVFGYVDGSAKVVRRNE